MTLVKIPSGKFIMGSDYPGNQPVEVTLTRPTWMASREVTVEQFDEFANDAEYFKQHFAERLAGFRGHDNIVSKTPDSPVQQISWHDAVSFCNWMSRRNGLTPCYQVQPKGSCPGERRQNEGQRTSVGAERESRRLPPAQRS